MTRSPRGQARGGPEPGKAWKIAAGAIRPVAALGVLAAVAVSAAFFPPWLALWLALLAGVTLARGWLGVSILFVFISLDSARPVFGGIVVDYSEIEFSVCLLAWVASGEWRGTGVDWRPLKWGAPLAAVVFLSAAVNNEWFRVVPHVIRSSEWTLALFLAANALRGAPRRDVFRWFLGAAALLYAGAGILQFWTPVRAPRVFSFFNNANQFAAYLNLLLPGLLAAFLWTRGGRLRWLWGLLVCWTGLAALGTQSRAGLGAGLASCVLVCLLPRGGEPRSWIRRPLSLSIAGTRRWALTLTLAALLAGLGVFLAIRLDAPKAGLERALHAVQSRARGDLFDDLLGERTAYYRLGWEIWKDHPWLGVGPGNFSRTVFRLAEGREDSTGLTRSKYKTTHVHNLYLQLCVDFGVFGLAAFLALAGRLFLEFWRARGDSAWALTGVGVLAAFFLHNLLDVTYPSLGLETGLLLGACLLPRPLPGRAEAPEPGPSRAAATV